MDFSELTVEQKEGLIGYLRGFVTAHKQGLIDEILQVRTRHITVVLEDIFQPHNASAVLRSAECFGLQDVHIIENENEYRLNKDVTRGAAKWLTLHQYREGGENTRPCLEALKGQGYTVAAATLRPGSARIASPSAANVADSVFSSAACRFG